MLLAAMVLLPPLFSRLFAGSKGITITVEAISTGRRSARWERITKIHKGRLRASPVTLTIARRNRRRLALRAYPVVFREVLPLIVERCPGVRVSARVRRAMDDPEEATSMPRWTALLLLGSVLCVAMIPFVARYAEMWWFLTMPVVLATLSLPLLLASGPPHTGQQHFVVEVGGSLAVMGWMLTVHLLHDVPMYALDSVAALWGVLFLAAAAVAGLRAKLGFFRKAVVLCCAVIVPLGIYDRGSARAVAKQDITRLLGKGPSFLPFFWSRDGNLTVDVSADGSAGEQQRVVNLANLKSIPLPVHEGFQMVWGLDDSCVVRLVSGKGKRALYVYRFADQREVLQATADRIVLAMGQCISPNGRWVCWLELTHGQPGKGSLKIYDLKTDDVASVEIAWPQDKDIEWTSCGWIDDAKLGVLGYVPGLEVARGDPQQLHVLTIRRDGRTVEHNVSPQRFLRWRVSPDFEHAFAAEPETADRSVTYYLDLGANSCVPVGGQSLPVWEFDGRYAFRTVDFGEPGVWLCRFDTEGAEETKLLKIPRGGHLASLSARAVRIGQARPLQNVISFAGRRSDGKPAATGYVGSVVPLWNYLRRLACPIPLGLRLVARRTEIPDALSCDPRRIAEDPYVERAGRLADFR